MVLDNQLDRLRESLTLVLPLKFHRYKEVLCLVDVWRMENGNKMDYTFYSHRHNTPKLIFSFRTFIYQNLLSVYRDSSFIRSHFTIH